MVGAASNADTEKGPDVLDNPNRDEQAQPPPQVESNYGDSSGQLFSLYSMIAKEQDDEMTSRWQQDAKDILIFTGLFSAAVSALLAVSVLDLKPNSQDISAFYLANIYQVLADPNVTVSPTSIPSAVAKPPPFSPPRSAIWVNSLWFLSLVINLTCALLATSLHQWSRRYTRFTQPPRSGPEKRARLRSFFRGGMDKLDLPSTVEALPALIHLSLFLFFAGLAIFLFNIDHSVFISVIWWIVGFIAKYGCMTVMPIFRHDSPYYSPLSSTAWMLHAILSYTLYGVLALIPAGRFVSCGTRDSFLRLSKHYRSRISGDVQKAAEETTSEWAQSSEFDRDILDCTISGALGDDKSLETFFEAIPGFFNSPLVNNNNLKEFLHDKPEVRSKIVDSLDGFLARNLSSNSVSEDIKIRRLVICMNAAKEIGEPRDICSILSRLRKGILGEDDSLLEKLIDIIPDLFNSMPKGVPERDMPYHELRDALDGFLSRTLSSNTVIELVQNRRLDIYLDAINVIYGPYQVRSVLVDILAAKFGRLPPSMEITYTLSHWCAPHEDLRHMVRIAPRWVGETLIHVPTRKRDDRWIAFVEDQFGLSKDVLWENVNHGDDSVLLAIFNHVAYRAISTADSWDWCLYLLPPLSKFDIRDTRPELQTKFCAIWNEIVQKARDSFWLCKPGPTYLLCRIRHLYVALHQGTDAAPTAFDASTTDKDLILESLSSYPICNVATHQECPSTSTSSKFNPVHIPPQGTVPSIHDFIQTLGPDLNRLVSNLSMLVSLFSPQSSSPTANLTTKIGRNDELTPNVLINEMGETAQTHTMTLLTSTFPQHPDPVPIIVTPSIAAHPPSVFVEQGDPNKQDTTASHVSSNIPQVSSKATQVPHSIPNTGVILQPSEESTGIPPTTVSDSQLSVIATATRPSRVIPTEPPSSVESALVQPDHLSRTLGSPSSIITTGHSHSSPQTKVPPVSDVHFTTSIGDFSSREHDETRDPNPPIPKHASLHIQQSGPSTSEA